MYGSIDLLIAVLKDSPLALEVRGLLRGDLETLTKQFNRLGSYESTQCCPLGRSKPVPVPLFVTCLWPAVFCPFYRVPVGGTHRYILGELWCSGTR